MRPSLLVSALKGAEGPKGRIRVSDTDISRAGSPVVRSRTWHVMESLGGEVGRVEEGFGEFSPASSMSHEEKMRCVASQTQEILYSSYNL